MKYTFLYFFIGTTVITLLAKSKKEDIGQKYFTNQIKCICNYRDGKLIKNSFYQSDQKALKLEYGEYLNTSHNFKINYPKAWNYKENYNGSIVIFYENNSNSEAITSINITNHEIPQNFDFNTVVGNNIEQLMQSNDIRFKLLTREKITINQLEAEYTELEANTNDKTIVTSITYLENMNQMFIITGVCTSNSKSNTVLFRDITNSIRFF